MIKLGEYNTLKAVRFKSAGMFLEDEEGNDVLLPNKYVPKDLFIDDDIQVFVYKDSEDRIVATTQHPKIEVNTFAGLRVHQVNEFGAFLDWGLDKHLLVPFREQATEMSEGSLHVVYLYLDKNTERLVATTRINKFLNNDDIAVKSGDEVELLVIGFSELGVNVIINNRHKGLIYKDEIFEELQPGQKINGYIKKIRTDNKIDVCLQKQGYVNIEPNAEKILQALKENNGVLELSDKSDSILIKEQLQMSKKTFKKAIGLLYKQKLIKIEPESIKLINDYSTSS